MIKEVLALGAHTRNAGIFIERYTKHEDGGYCYPDIYAKSWQGAPAAFEIQLSTTHMPVILRREEFYESCGIRLIWIVGHHEKGPDRRAFRDIHMRNDGQTLGMDGEVAEAARQQRSHGFGFTGSYLDRQIKASRRNGKIALYDLQRLTGETQATDLGRRGFLTIAISTKRL